MSVGKVSPSQRQPLKSEVKTPAYAAKRNVVANLDCARYVLLYSLCGNGLLDESLNWGTGKKAGSASIV